MSLIIITLTRLHTLATSVIPGDLPQTPAGTSQIKTILSIVFESIGALALVIIVVAGLRYITSAGNPQKASSAKNAIIYALVGLAIAITAQAIVSLVGSKL